MTTGLPHRRSGGPRYVLVTGTDTGVGKTVATAALAVRSHDEGRQVAVVKPVQTGCAPGEPGDVDEVRRLAGLQATAELVRLAEPLAPESAARRAGASLPDVDTLAARTVTAGAGSDLVLVEGSGGVTVRLDTAGGTLIDLGRTLERHGPVQVVVVVRAGLGTLNHTVLTVDALRAAGLGVAGLVVGCWPERPDLAARVNRSDLPRLSGVPLLAVLPAGAGTLSGPDFRRLATGWFTAAPGADGEAQPTRSGDGQ